MTEKYARWVPNEAAEPQFGGEGVTRRVLAYTDGLMCVENTFEKGAVGALHSHPHTQITYVAEGVFSFTIDGETRTVRKGDTMLKENGVIHGCTCLEKGVLLDIFTPMREDFVGKRRSPAPGRGAFMRTLDKLKVTASVLTTIRMTCKANSLAAYFHHSFTKS